MLNMINKSSKRKKSNFYSLNESSALIDLSFSISKNISKDMENVLQNMVYDISSMDLKGDNANGRQKEKSISWKRRCSW